MQMGPRKMMVGAVIASVGGLALAATGAGAAAGESSASSGAAANLAGAAPSATALAARRALPGTVLDAVVSADGTLARGRGALSATAIIPGRYAVVFRYNIRNCAYVATVGLPGSLGFSPSGEVTTVGLFSDRRGVFLATADSAGRTAARGFHLVVTC